MKTLLIAIAIGFAALSGLPAEPVAGDSRCANLHGNKIHYTSYGKGEPTLVFIHGWACDETVWNAQALELAHQFRCLTIDLPGHGQSDRPEIDYTMPFYASAIDAVLRDAKVSSAILVGHSNGVPVVRQFYRGFPASVRGLVLVEGGLRPFVDAVAMEKFLAPMRGPDYPAVAGKLIDSMTQPIADAALRARIKKLMLATPQHVAVSEFESTADPEIWKEDRIDVPVLMILAKQPAWTADYEQFVRGLVPKLDYQVWDHVSHFVMMEKPTRFNKALAAFASANRG